MDALQEKKSGRSCHIGRYLYAKGSKAECVRLGEELERTQGMTSWTIAPLDAGKSIWGLFI